jgi:hypothetical protein
VRHHRHKRRRTSKHQAPPVSLLPCGEGEAVVLSKQGSYQWFYQNKEAINTWDKCAMVFLAKFFPMSKTSALRGKIMNF